MNAPTRIAAPGDHVLIVGGGFSGTLLAINLLRHEGPGATLIERRPSQVARGVAYSAAHPSHLLNVRAGNMSALPDEPDHFVRWLASRGEGGRTSFVPRTTYGAYLREMLDAACARAPGRLRLIEGEAVDLRHDQGGVALTLADGEEIAGDAAVLAVGNLPPHDPPGLGADSLPPSCYSPDPWAVDIGEGLGDDDTAVLIGTGLTAVDAALLLDAGGFGGRILALSRRGLAPHRHQDGLPHCDPVLERPSGPLSAVVAHVRARAAEAGWRTAVDELRPMTHIMWGAATGPERARFLRHARPYWDIHRHRLAPAIANRIDALVSEGRLTFAGGKPVGIEAHARGATLRWRPRGTAQLVETRAARIVNCTGPQGDLLRSREPLLRRLLDAGAIRPDPLRLGLDVDAQSRIVNQDGAVSDRLHAIGPMTRGGVWEIVAVPDIRWQSWNLARRLSNAQWVGGEGL
ncbi:FAD/NAD(P)-binding protein [uncultured Sphingomonas sp.]|uniref:FAD/NAD(P)-binding protein n=1 Tax=uncultured Sphingomonas sp. TaxID=158754 RepID=UPI0035CB8163